MELALTQHLIYLPPLLVAGLIALYRNNILCFWQCNPVGIALHEFQGQVALRTSAVLHMARSTALMIRNFPSHVAVKIHTSTDLMIHILHSTALQIITTIQGILVTIQQSLSLTLSEAKYFLQQIFTVISNYAEYLRNTSIEIFKTASEPSNPIYIGFMIVTTLACISLIFYGYRQAQNDLTLEEKQDDGESVEEIEEKKPVRRRTKRVA